MLIMNVLPVNVLFDFQILTSFFAREHEEAALAGLNALREKDCDFCISEEHTFRNQ